MRSLASIADGTDRDITIGLRTADLTDCIDRVMLADLMDEAIRYREAIYLRSPNPLTIVRGRIEARVIRVQRWIYARGHRGQQQQQHGWRLIECWTHQRGSRSEGGVIEILLAKGSEYHPLRAGVSYGLDQAQVVDQAIVVRAQRGWVALPDRTYIPS